MNIRLLSRLFLLFLASAPLLAAEKKWHPAIVEALQSDNPAPLRNLIGAGFNIDVQDEGSGETVLMMAADWSKIQVIKLLINEGAKVDLQDKNGSTALHRAAQKNVEILKLLLSAKPNLKLATKRGLTAVETAALFGKRDAVELLLASGAQYEPDLVFASALGELSVLKEQVAKGADVNKVNKSGITPLAAAARTGQLQAVAELLRLKANPDAGGSTTPLIMAVGWHRVDVASALLEARADPNQLDGDELSPLVNAIRVRDAGAVNLLLEKGAKVSGVGKACSPIHEAARADDTKILSALVKQGADINATFYSGGFTPLMIAASENKPGATQFLLKQGARVGLKAKVTMRDGGLSDSSSEYQMTALQMAERNRFDTIVQIFQNPDAFKLADIERDDTQSMDIPVEDWKKKYAEFDPQRGRIATLAAFKKTFGEPNKVVDIDETSFWYYQCADGLIELKVVNIKNTGGQLIIQGLSTVAEPKPSGIPRKEGAAAPANGESVGGNPNVPSTVQPTVANRESPVQPKETNVRKDDSPTKQGKERVDATETLGTQRNPDPAGIATPSQARLSPQERQEQALLRQVELIGKTPASLNRILLRAAERGFTNTIEVCLAKGADINASDPVGTTPLMAAAQMGHSQAVKLLLAKGADASKANRFNKTAFDVAKDAEIISVLKAASPKK